MVSAPFTVLITGGNRGLGRALVSRYLLQSNIIVIAGVRSPSSPTSTSLHSLPRASSARLVIAEIDITSEPIVRTSLGNLIHHGTERLDLVVANAALVQEMLEPIVETSIPKFKTLVWTNGIGMLILLQQTLPLLRKSANPVFVNIASALGSFALLGQLKDLKLGTLGASKTLGQFILNRAAVEEGEDGVLMFMVEPGAVMTDAYRQVQETSQSGEHVQSPEVSAKKVREAIERATKERLHGKFLDCDGGEVPF